MRLLWQAPEHRKNEKLHSVAVFGSGLIGGSLLQSLEGRTNWQHSRYAYDWSSESQRQKTLTDVASALRHIYDVEKDNEHQLDVVWAAGRAGFSATQDSIDAEHACFQQVFDHFERLARSGIKCDVRFHLVSSAGGLFEGQRLVSRQSVPAPQRPYGFAKQAQEAVVLKDGRKMKPYIYRPSSVYGFNRVGDRIGLIAALISGAVRHQETVIFGRMSTLRDFVLANDVGEFLADKIMSSDVQSGTYLLASGKPTSMTEVIALVQKRMDRPLQLRYKLGDTNVADNTFSADSLPPNWRVTSLTDGVSQISEKIEAAFGETASA